MVQVIGEMSNKSAPHRKFVQTFILAEQPNGYYVLNDIFRYIADEEEEEAEEPASQAEAVAAPPQEPETSVLIATEEKLEQEKDIETLDKKLEEAAAKTEVQPAAVNAPSNSEPVAEEPNADTEPPALDEPAQTEPEAIENAEAAAAANEVEEELPKDPEPTKVPTPEPEEAPHVASPPAEEPVAPPKPAVPKTWASMVAGPKAPIPVVPQVSSANNTAPAAQPKPAPQPAPAPVTTTAANTEEALPSPGGWQTAGQDHGRKQGRQQSASVSTGPSDKGNVSAYIKGVIDKVDAASLKSHLSKFGKLDYFDVSRAKV